MHLSLLQRPLDTACMAAKLAHVITSCHYRSARNKEGIHIKGLAGENNIRGPHKLNNEMCQLLSKQRGLYWLLAIQNTQFIKTQITK